MTVQFWLKTATQFLISKKVLTARLDALVLLESVLRVDRAKLLAEPLLEMKDSEVDYLQKLLTRRAKHEPLAYILGYSEFYGRCFKITNAVLEPRPESEAMIELLKGLQDADKLPKEPRIADVGTGSGALGIIAKLELPKAQVELLEIDDAAIKVAQTNVDLFTLKILVTQSDLLDNATQENDVLLCNLPYVPDTYTINEAATYEPAIALFGGIDGLNLYRKLFQQIKIVDKKPLYILCESLPSQHHALATLARKYGYLLEQTDDFIQLFSWSAPLPV